MVMEKVQENWVRGTTIGRGSYGTVSLAVNKSSGGVFAVKSVERSSCLPHQLEALENEVRILRSLSSPYVVEYLGDGVTVEGAPAGTSFRNLYLEYCPGGTAADLARARKSGADVDERIVKDYTFCIASALKYLHSKGIVHCDIKSDNVLVGPYPCTAKLADFGSAMEVSPRGGGETKPKNNKILPRGSPMWMAPEVIRGEYQGPESDVWSLGCTIIEMVTGKPAWEDKGLAETLCRIGYLEELPLLPTQLSELGRDFLEKCLRREPNKRWSCDQLLQHPFISMSSAANSASHSSPRCILDWFSLDSDEEDNEERIYKNTCFPLLEERNTDDEICISRIKDRIREYASGTGANWDSDGWVVVRSSESSDAGRDEEEGTSSAYSELIEVESEITRASLENADSRGTGEVSRRANMENFLDSNSGPLQEEAQNDRHNDVVTTDHEVGHFLLLCYLLSNISRQNYSNCSQTAILLTHIRIFCYIFLSLGFHVLDNLITSSYHIHKMEFRIGAKTLWVQYDLSWLIGLSEDELELFFCFLAFPFCFWERSIQISCVSS